MKPFWLNVLIFVIGLSAIVVEKPFLQGTFAHLEALQTVPVFQTNAIQNQHDNKYEKSLHIAEAFEAIVLLADFSMPAQAFFHYLPLYSLNRIKDFFLLI